MPKIRIRKYLRAAYKVYSGQQTSSVVAHIAEDIQEKTGYPRDIIVKRAFFEKIAKDHPELPKEHIFEFIKTINLNETDIYHYPLEQKLKFFKILEDETVHFVAIGLDFSKQHMNLITHYITKKANWIANTKDTGEPVSFGRAERTLLPSFPA